MSSADPTTAPVPPTLREPVNRVSDRAVSYWRVAAVLGALVFAVPLTIVVSMLPVHPWWAWAGIALIWGVGLARVLVMPIYRYRVHRWEVTQDAVFTRSGWISREQRIAPLSRVQTVDSHQSVLMRPFHLSTITVTTASAAGPLRIDCLDEEVARRTVAELTEITAASEGDAT
ncbi:MAG: PH domain-containing protein [Nocardioidaceae bacterium]|nr:PH domain-containing protein [Nocardioidaceae bacterium]